MKIHFSGEIFNGENLSAGICELAPHYGYTPVFGDESAPLTVRARRIGERQLAVHFANGQAEIVFQQKAHFFRGLGLLLLELSEGKEQCGITEDVQFDKNGPMYDVSQGSGVINLPTLRRFIRNMALLGLNMLMLYCEDSYDVEGEPYFGYMRSRYSEADMRALDDYADMFGIEMIPCIQTLAHLHEVLKWKKVYGAITDYPDCLLVDEEKTYTFIRHMIESAAKPFRTKRIHIGMDEAGMLGQGEYLHKNGFRPSDEIMRRHLARVMEIVRELGLEPMMWSDMFFNAPGTTSYYNHLPVRPEALAALPEGMRLIYWDYYHFNSEDFYLEYIDKHRRFGEPLFAGGIWTWFGFGAYWGKTFNSTKYALSACKKRGVREVFATVWGDCDTECNVNITLPGIVLYAEHGFSPDEPSEETMRRRFAFVCRANYDDFMALQYFDHMGENAKDDLGSSNPSKCLMWQDILCGLFDKNIEGVPYDTHYARLAETFARAAERGGHLAYVMEFCYHVSHTLALKATMGLRLTAAYKAGDRSLLKKLAEEDLPELKRRMTALRESHRSAWLKTYKPLGFETFDARYGAAISRTDTAIALIGMYLAGELESIAELEEERLGYDGSDSKDIFALSYNKIAFSHRLF